MKKGDLVTLNEAVCFRASRPTSGEEQREWYDSPESKGMNSAGESKLPPQSVGVTIYADRKYVVERARCRVRLGWGNPTPGMAKILCTSTGEIAYIKREYLRVI